MSLTKQVNGLRIPAQETAEGCHCCARGSIDNVNEGIGPAVYSAANQSGLGYDICH